MKDTTEQTPGLVSRCVCFDRSLRELRSLCGDNPGRLRDACRATGCGSKCGLCVPYLLAAISCKADELGVLWSEDFNRMGIEPGRIAALEMDLIDRADKKAAGPV